MQILRTHCFDTCGSSACQGSISCPEKVVYPPKKKKKKLPRTNVKLKIQEVNVNDKEI